MPQYYSKKMRFWLVDRFFSKKEGDAKDRTTLWLVDFENEISGKDKLVSF
jgi:hypothetical protein